MLLRGSSHFYGQPLYLLSMLSLHNLPVRN